MSPFVNNCRHVPVCIESMIHFLLSIFNRLDLNPCDSTVLPYTSQYFSGVQNPEELVFGRGLVKVGRLLVDEEGVRNPHQFDILRADN
jgi:hypothetical protein